MAIDYTGDKPMTKRDYFAIQILNGLLSCDEDLDMTFDEIVKQLSEISYVYADKMLKISNK